MNNKKQIICSVLLVFFILIAFFHTSHQTGLAEKKAYIVEEDIIYGKVDGVELKLNLARPAKGRRQLPALVFIFGGGWAQGSRIQYSSQIRQAAERGYVAVTVDYRLTNVRENGKVKYTFPAQIHDVKCAVRWLRANAKRYKIDPNRIGAVGWSSGGHLALMLGLTDPSNGLEGECGDLQHSSSVQAVVSLAAPIEMRTPGEIRFYSVPLLGGTPEEVPELYTMASPLTYVGNDDSSFLIIHGDNDSSVPFNNAELLNAKMNEMGTVHTFIIKKGSGHFIPVDNDVWDFFDEHLKGN